MRFSVFFVALCLVVVFYVAPGSYAAPEGQESLPIEGEQEWLQARYRRSCLENGKACSEANAAACCGGHCHCPDPEKDCHCFGA